MVFSNSTIRSVTIVEKKPRLPSTCLQNFENQSWGGLENTKESVDQKWIEAKWKLLSYPCVTFSARVMILHLTANGAGKLAFVPSNFLSKRLTQ
jgi:hypothetical protein